MEPTNYSIPFVPEQASTFAREVDILYWTISGLTLLFTLIVGVMVVTFVNKYKRGKVADRSNPQHDNFKLEMVLIIIPTILGLGIFAWGAKLFVEMRTPPKDAMEVFVIGKQWMWQLQHAESGIRENNELHVPIGQPVKLTMISQDVIHGFYIPAFRIQYHVVPGRYTSQWFTASKVGRYHIFCTIHCGTQHSEMGGFVTVMSRTDWAKWVSNGGNSFKEPPKNFAESGKRIYEEMACGTCHSNDDTEKAPTLVGLYGRKRDFINGPDVVADEDYIRESIINPYERINKGYDNTMPVYEYRKEITEEQLRDVIEYIKSLGFARANEPAKVPAIITGTPQ